MSLLLLLLVAAQPVDPAPITVVGSGWAPFISPMGEPFRSKQAGDDPLAAWFGQADGNRDGALGADEMRADADRFFALLDSDGNREIGPDEVVAYEWTLAREVQVNSQWRRGRGEPQPTTRRKRERAAYDPDAPQGAARYGLLNMPQPVTGADADLNRAVTLAEFRQAAAQRFALLDRGGDRQLTLSELRAIGLPDRKKRWRARKGAPDPRIAVPVPIGD